MELLHPSDRKRFKNFLKRTREDVQPFMEKVKARVPAVTEAIKEAELKIKDSWTAVSESFDEPTTAELDTVELVPAAPDSGVGNTEEAPVKPPLPSTPYSGVSNTEEAPVKPPIHGTTITPWPNHQRVAPDMLDELVLIQRGGFGDIYRGRSRAWRLPVALKMIRGADRHTMKELMKEAKMMKIADFPYVLRLLGLYQKEEGEFVEYGLVMEYMPNGSLYTLFRSVKPVPWALRFQLLHQVALGMNYLHSLSPPLLHLDLKPKNVLLDHSLVVRLADFGLSKLKNITSSAGGGGVGGTLPYKAPESLNDINYHPREPFDVYSYGILTWSVLSAEEPYPYAVTDLIKLQVPQGQRPDEKSLEPLDNIEMVPEAKNLMRCCWHTEPEARPPFLECIERTEPMFAAYKDKIDAAIRSTQDQLKKPIQLKNQEPATLNNQTTEAHSTYIGSESFHACIFKTKPAVMPTPSTGPLAATATQHRPTEVSAPAKQKGSSEAGSQREFLRKNFLRLRDEIPSVQPLLDQLIGEKIFNREEVETILAKETPTDRIRTMLHAILKKGEDTSERFCHLLNENYPNLLRSLEDK